MKTRILGAALAAVVGLSLAACEKSQAPASAPPAAPATTAQAHDAQSHEHASPHGGVVASTSQGHLELVASRDGAFKLYLLDDGMKPQPATGASGTLKLTVPGYADVQLSPEGDALTGKGTPIQAEHATAVVSVTSGGTTRTGRFALHLEAEGHGHEHGATSPGFKAELASPPDLSANRPATLTFVVKDARGATVRELPLVHEKPMHLLVVSNDLKDFFHLHPEPQADGTFRVQHTFPSGGDYTAFVDFTPQGSPQVVERIPLTVKGPARAKAALQADATFTRSVDGLRVTMTPSKPLRAGDGLMLNFAVTDEKTGKPVADLQPYLGAMAHFVILSEDLKDFLHAHPMDGTPGSGTVAAHTTFPRPGLYKVWAQMQRNGKVVTVPFVLNVSEGTSAPASEHSEHPEHHH